MLSCSSCAVVGCINTAPLLLLDCPAVVHKNSTIMCPKTWEIHGAMEMEKCTCTGKHSEHCVLGKLIKPTHHPSPIEKLAHGKLTELTDKVGDLTPLDNACLECA